jgi:hypothetical protein
MAKGCTSTWMPDDKNRVVGKYYCEDQLAVHERLDEGKDGVETGQ